MDSKIKIIITLGILIAIFPFFEGFPVFIENTFFVLAGLTIAILSYFVYRFSLFDKNTKSVKADEGCASTFSENKEDFIK